MKKGFKRVLNSMCYHDEKKPEVDNLHYENKPMIFHCCKNDNFQLKIFDYFHIFAPNIDRGYTLEPPH